MMKKRALIFLTGLVLLVGLTTYVVYAQGIQYGQDTVISIYQNDENGTPITSPAPVKLVGKAGHRNPFRPELTGYELVSPDPLGKRLPRGNRTVKLRYRSKLTKQQVQTKLETAKYWQVGTQNVATPGFNGTQVQKSATPISRLSTSRDGKHWTKLPISYPHVAVKAPTMLYQNGTLTLFDQEHTYATTDFRHWQKRPLTLRSTTFKRAQLVTALPAQADQPAQLVVRATSQTTGKTALFYGRWAPNQAVRWRALKLTPTQLKGSLNVTRVGQQYYYLRAQGAHVWVYRAAHLNGSFKRVQKLKLNVRRHDRVNSLNLIASGHGRYRLFFNAVDRENVQTGTYYRELSSKLKPVKRQSKLEPDFIWTNFKLMENPS